MIRNVCTQAYIMCCRNPGAIETDVFLLNKLIAALAGSTAPYDDLYGEAPPERGGISLV